MVARPHDVDKYGIAGALAGQPIELVKCVSVDLEVPASAEIVLEGRLLAGKREVEGPFGDRGGTYGTVEPRPVIEISAVTMRRDASTTRP